MATLYQNPLGFNAKNGASKGAKAIAWMPAQKKKTKKDAPPVEDIKPTMRKKEQTINDILNSI